MLNVGGSVASNFLKTNVAQYQPRVSGYWNTLKVYFTVRGLLYGERCDYGKRSTVCTVEGKRVTHT